ncbi:MAG: cell division protein FtsZ [Alphaproteobacteria bacterium]
MTLTFTPPGPDPELKPRIVVIGVGGAGGNAVNNMIGSNLEGVEFIAANTDAQALKFSKAERKIQLGTQLTQGLGAGAKPQVGREAAEEAMEELMDHLQGTHMVFITAGMGGGTGTGAAPVIAEACRENNILTVGVVTKPFDFEGAQRRRLAEEGIEELQDFVDTLIIIPNQNLFRVANEKTTFADAFKMADDVLYSGVRGVTDLMVMPGLINLDFADIRTVMSEMGKAMMGTGESEGEHRALKAAEAAIANPLLEDVSMRGAQGVLINITGGGDMTLFEVDEAANRIRDEVATEANIIFGSTFDENLEGKMRVSVVATGIDSEESVMNKPTATRSIPMTRPKIVVNAVREEAQPEPIVAAETTVQEAIVAIEETASVDESVGDAVDSDEPDVLEFVDDDESGTAETSARTVAQEPEGADAAEPAQTTATEEKPAATEAGPATEPGLFGAMEKTPASTTVSSKPSTDEASAARKLPEVTIPRDAFRPPPPAMPEESATNGKGIDPFGEADLANGRAESGRRSRSNIFRRVTNLMGASKEPAQNKADPKPAASAQPPAQPKEPETVTAAKATQQTLPSPNPEDRATPSKADEEMLEIPAFLRRQAN